MEEHKQQIVMEEEASRLQGVSAEEILAALERLDQGSPGIGTWIILILCGGYFLLGAIDLIPDIIPVVGELDDGVAAYFFFRNATRIWAGMFGGRFIQV